MPPKSALPDPAAFAHVTEWVFDLDNTLYPVTPILFSQIDKKMTQYVANAAGLEHDDARAIQKNTTASTAPHCRG
jgi:putative hydrolase of the HAD superfamily